MSVDRGLAETLHGIVGDLRNTSALVDLLTERQAIYAGHPADHRGYPVSVVVTPIYGGTTLHRGTTTRDARVQITVKATQAWREAREPNPGALAAMYEIMDHVGVRLDRASGLSQIPLGGEGGPEPQPLDDGRLAVTSDWRLRGFVSDAPDVDGDGDDSSGA